MTRKERNSINDRERIKLYIESSIRMACDDISDGETANLRQVHDEILKLSKIYKNMGFDKDGGKE